MTKRILNRLAILLLTLTTLTGCDLELQKNYDYDSSVLDPHIDMTAWEYFETRTDIFSTLIAAIEHAGLKEYYTQTEHQYTYLALTNTAMKSYMADRFPGISDITGCDKEQVKNILLYHIVDGNYSAYGQLDVEPMFVLTMLKGENGLMTMLVRKNPWQADAGKIVINDTGSNGNSPTKSAISSNIMPVNGVVHVFDSYCYYKK